MIKDKEIKRIEWWVKLAVIPVSVVLAALLMLTPPEAETSFMQRFVDGFFAIVFMWIMVRFLIFRFRKWMPKKSQVVARIALTAIISSGINAGVIMLFSLYYSHTDPHHLSFWHCFYYSKPLLLGTTMFAMMLITLYESFHILSEKMAYKVASEQFKQESIEAKFQNLKNQINPHFLFNSFNTLSNLIEEDAEKAVGFVHELSDVYRYVLNSRDKDWTSFAEEMELVNSFVYMLKVRFEDKLTFNIDVDQSKNDLYLPPVSLQLLIENAIKHNEISSDRPLTISISTDGDMVIVSNNKQLRKSADSSTGIGLNNIRERYSLLSDQDIEVIDSKTEFTVKLPLIQITRDESPTD